MERMDAERGRMYRSARERMDAERERMDAMERERAQVSDRDRQERRNPAS